MIRLGGILELFFDAYENSPNPLEATSNISAIEALTAGMLAAIPQNDTQTMPDVKLAKFFENETATKISKILSDAASRIACTVFESEQKELEHHAAITELVIRSSANHVIDKNRFLSALSVLLTSLNRTAKDMLENTF